jgi:type II secretory pathway predicted ATPase ExeA
MYESFFQLTDRPFAATPQIEQYYPARAIEAARRTLVRCIDRAEGVGVLIGPSGTGKTLVCQLLRHQFQDAFEVVLLGSTRIDTPRALLQAILFGLELECRGRDDGDLRLTLVDHLTRGEASRSGLLLIADEAHTLPARVLEEIRLITNVTVGGQPRVRFVMVGSPLLEEHLSSPKLESFSQRAAARCYLEPLDRGETAEYIRAQMAAAGVNALHVFAEAALVSVYRAADGIPRLINQLCDHALVLAFAQGVKHIGEREIEEAWADLQQLPTPWNASAQPGRADAVIEFGQLDDDQQVPEPARVGLRLAAGLDDADAGPEERLERIEESLASIEVGAQPQPATNVEVSQSVNPFAELFDHEEVVVDRFQSAYAAVWDQMPHVYSSEGQVLAKLLETIVETAEPAEITGVAAWGDAGDPDLIIVEDDPVIVQATRAVSSRAVRTEYSQLFAKLRRG